MHNEDVPNRPATTVDLSKVKCDLKEEITATKQQIAKAKSEMRKEVATVKNELKGDDRRLAIRLAGLDVKFLELKRDIFESNQKLASGFFSRLDSFMARAIKVETDQTFLIHRMDSLEGRVNALESRSS